MWSDLFLSTVDADYQRTVAQPADLTGWEDRPDAVPDVARVWGVNDAGQNRRTFEQMESGDYVLFYRVGSEQYVGAGRISAVCEDVWVAEQYWSMDRPLLFVLDSFAADEVPLRTVNDVLEYQDIYHPQGLVRASDRRPIEDAVALFDLE